MRTRTYAELRLEGPTDDAPQCARKPNPQLATSLGPLRRAPDIVPAAKIDGPIVIFNWVRMVNAAAARFTPS